MAVRVGIVTGSGSYAWPGFDGGEERRTDTPFGTASVTIGRVGEVEVVHLARHGAGHARLSNQVDHRANLAALLAARVQCLISLTVCGTVDPTVGPGSLVVFDDLYFPSNRLPDGSLCTWQTEPGEAGRGHWIFDGPFSPSVRRALIEAAADIGISTLSTGCYGHVDGPRFNSRSEIAALAGCGVTAVSQTAGPEVVLAGEAELPMALVGYVTDYANGVVSGPPDLAGLGDRMQASTEALARVVNAALPRLGELSAPGSVYRFGA